MSSSSDSSGLNNRNTSDIYSVPLIQHSELVWLYRNIHDKVLSAAGLANDACMLVSYYVGDTVARVASGNFRNVTVFKRGMVKTTGKEIGQNRWLERIREIQGIAYEDVPALSKEASKLRKRKIPPKEIKRIRLGAQTLAENPHVTPCAPFDLAETALLTSGMDHLYREAVGSSFPASVEHLPFVPAVANILVESFCRATKDYTTRAWAALRLKQELYTDLTLTREQRSVLAHKIAEHQTWMDRLHHRLGVFDPDTFYGVVRNVQWLVREVRAIQERVITSFRRLAMQVAKTFGRSTQQILDNYQNGCQGLYRAIVYWDASRNRALSGVARWWVQAHVLNRIKIEANLVVVPPTVWPAYSEYERIRNEEGLEEYDYAGLAVVTGDSVEKIAEVYLASQINRPSSLESPLGDDDSGTTTLGSRLESELPSPEENAQNNQPVLEKYLSRLSLFEQTVICCTYGCLHLIPEEEALDIHDIERERIRQQAAALYLKHGDKK